MHTTVGRDPLVSKRLRVGAKADATRARIIDAALELFNTKGYAGTSISDVLDAAEIKKGGLYRHFESKDEIALAAFDRAVERLLGLYLPSMASTKPPLQRLHACIDAAARSIFAPPVPGGCPILNTAIEADLTNEPLRKRAAAAMSVWHGEIRRAVHDGINDGTMRPGTDDAAVASIVTGGLEGAIMLALLYRDPSHMTATATHLHVYVDSLASAPVAAKKTSPRRRR